jgi:hypothetical protein
MLAGHEAGDEPTPLRARTSSGERSAGAWEELFAVVRKVPTLTMALTDAAPPVRHHFDRTLGSEPQPTTAAVLQMTGHIKSVDGCRSEPASCWRHDTGLCGRHGSLGSSQGATAMSAASGAWTGASSA